MKKQKDTLDKICDIILENSNAKRFDDVSNITNELQSRIIQKLLDAEMEQHLGFSNNDKNDKETDNRRNGYSSKGKKVKTSNGEFFVNMPRDRDGTFEPLIIKKRQRVIRNEDLEDAIIAMYAKGNSDNDIKDLLLQIYKINLSTQFISNVITKVSEEVQEWHNKPVKPIYAFLFIDCLYVDIKTDLVSKKRPVYNIIGIDLEGKKEVVGVWIGDSESEGATYWRGIFSELKERGLEDILYVSMDGLKGLPEAINDLFAQTKVQRCIVHLVRNLYKECLKKESKEVIADFKKIYSASSLDESKELYNDFIEKYKDKSKIVKKVTEYMQYIEPLFEVPQEIRKVIYTTNAVESVNYAYRKVTNGKGAFPNEEAVYKVLFLRVKDLEKKWDKPIANWKTILNQLVNLFENRIEKYLDV